MNKKQFQLPSFQMKRRLFSKRKPSAHAKKWLNGYFKENDDLTVVPESDSKEASY